MNVRSSSLGESAKKIFQQLRLKIAHAPRGRLPMADAINPAREIYCRSRQTVVHGHQEVAGTQNSPLRTERLPHRFAQRDSHIFHRVMLVHVKIALGDEIEIHGPVARDLLEHVIEEADARRDSGSAAAIQIQADANIGFFRGSVQTRFPHTIAFNSRNRSRISRRVPIVMRTYPSPAKSLERSRNRIPFRARRETISFARLPKFTRMKFAALGNCSIPSVRSPRSSSRLPWETSCTVRVMNARSRIAASAEASAATFTGYGDCAFRKCGAISRCAKTQPSRSPAIPAAFENVRVTIRLGNWRIERR